MKALRFMIPAGMELAGIVLFANLMGLWPTVAMILVVGGRTLVAEARHDYKMGKRQ